jgi:mono/diheme cytochrome c family protein
MLTLPGCSTQSGRGGTDSLSSDILEGQTLFLLNGCDGCHGKDGRGDTGFQTMLNPPPRNFENIQDYRNGITVEKIESTIETGIPGTAMVGFPHIPKRDRLKVARFIRSLQKR